MATLKLSYVQNGAVKGIDDDPDNPLSRALNNLFRSKHGQPFKRLSQCFCKDDQSILRWFGIFIETAGDKVLFFPGFNSTFDSIQGYRGNTLRWEGIFEIDHLTLEKNYKSWHITSSNKSEHKGNLPILPLDEDSFLWFGLSVSNFNILRIVKEETLVLGEVDSSDFSRRTEIFEQARSNAVFKILEFHPEALLSLENNFLHFGVLVGKKGFEYRGEELGMPEGSPFLVEPFNEGHVTLPIRIHRISLSDKIDVQITTLTLPGQLRTPVTITSKK